MFIEINKQINRRGKGALLYSRRPTHRYKEMIKLENPHLATIMVTRFCQGSSVDAKRKRSKFIEKQDIYMMS